MRRGISTQSLISRIIASITRRSAALIASAILAAFAYFADKIGFGFHETPIASVTREVQVQTPELDPSRIWTWTRDMTAVQNAAHHFQKHGAEFGFKTEAEYVTAAVAFTKEPPPADIMTNIQKDGDKAFYNPKTAEYAVKSKRGRIRTYFKLDPRIHGYKSNTEYFNAHAGVGHPPPANDNRQ